MKGETPMKSESHDWRLRAGNVLFKYRSFTPLPVLALVFLLFRPLDMGSLNGWMIAGGLFLSLAGELIRILAVGFSYAGTSGRENFLKAESINSTGVYSLSRNPLYIGNILIFSGLLVVFSNGYALVMVMLFLVAQYHFIIRAEERFLDNRHGKAYREYCREVPRIFSGFRRYTKPATAFNLRKVIFKENDSLFNLIMVFILILVIRELTFYNSVNHAVQFMSAASILIVLYILVKLIKKRERTGR
jgi:protein-S-isoprenylcysteine O-methyltransferase Ste14